jgi:hypothetical protein
VVVRLAREERENFRRLNNKQPAKRMTQDGSNIPYGVTNTQRPALPIDRSRHLLDQKTIGPSCSPTRLGSNRKRHLATLLDRFVVVKDLKPLVSCPPRVRQLLPGSRRTQNREGSRPRDPLFSKQELFNGTVPGILEATSNAHDRPDPALGYVHNYRPVHGA